MATLISNSGSAPSGRNAPFRVATREISLDFATVGPEQSPNELGALSEPVFLALLEKFATIPAVKLIDGDPQLVVTAKRGRYIVLPSAGKLLIRPANDPQQPYVKYETAALPAFLDTTDQQEQGHGSPKNFQTLIGSAAAIVAESENTLPDEPAAPIYGTFPSRAAGPVTIPPKPPTTSPSAPAPASAAPVRRKSRRGLFIGLGIVAVLTAAGSLWVFLAPAPVAAELPAAPAGEFDPVRAGDQLASLKKRIVGTYATSGDSGERLLEIRANGTYHYQEFGTGLATTTNRSGTFTFAFRHGTQTPVIRASGMGTIEIRDEKSLLYHQIPFTKLP